MKAIIFSVLAVPALAFPYTFSSLQERDGSCGGVTGLNTCGASFPSEFCCPQQSTCLPLNVTGAIAVVCCPSGNCQTVQPTTCDTTAYDPTKVPGNPVHASPVPSLATCGSACCPPGYACQNNNCVAQPAPTSSSSASLSTTTITSTVIPAIPSSTAAPVANTTASPDAAAIPTQQQSFNGSSFAAGFVPGIIIGILLLLAFFWLIARRRKDTQYGPSEKSKSHDQLTTLSPHPAAIFSHNRSISEPIASAEGDHRSDFLRSKTFDNTRAALDQQHGSIEAGSFPSTTNTSQSRPLYRFSDSPGPPASPLPAHMKRGTLSYTISPIRQLKTKQSMHSLRRHMLSDHANNLPQGLKPHQRSQRSRRSPVLRTNSSGSTETIRVLMSPDERFTPPRDDYNLHVPAIVLDRDAQSKNSDRQQVTSSLYSPSATVDTPTRKPSRPQPGPLGSPYTPRQWRTAASRAAVNRDSFDPPPVPRLPEESNDDRRMTTFSNLLERAGIYRDSVPEAPIAKK